ncbi:tyrosine-specific transport protein [Aeromonas sp. BIGb0405]|jgi:tyrosine-specific transport protein|uniref:aromatic amino acid transport family protein n=1 Tax=Aeromonas sp. BIGb0405 TaxID=2940592 RepID=UPI00216966B4|nr:aromatic amino acid transport family protein [Aeromonas sp. BIGb0405]MCS3455925.1 tyrosine-specific transport protein [Aeromonas sp. BIGb0405]
MNTKTLGCTLLIAGTTIGAGMLALPLASSSLGGPATLALMLGLWALMAFTAMLQVEASLSTGKWYLHQLADQLLGPWGKRIASFCILMLFYSLASAYISGGSSLLVQALADAGLSLSQGQAAWAFTLLFGGMVCVGTKQVDYLNRLMFTVKLVIMVAVLALLLPRAEGQHLLSMPLGQGLLLAGLPVIFTSFGFHGSIPSVMLYLGDCPKRLRRVFVWGSALPLILYVLWQVAILGLLGQQSLLDSGGALDSLLASVGKLVNWPLFNQAMHLFADLALATSFLGVTLGLFDFMAKVSKRDDNASGRLQTGLITFVPPLLFALYFPQGFIMALGYAAIALAILAVLLPVALVWQSRKQAEPHHYRAPGGVLALGVAGAMGVLIVGVQLSVSLGLLPAL